MEIPGENVANDNPHGDLHGAGDPAGGVFGITEFLFKKDTLDRQLMRKHLAGKFLSIY
jgi:hypothetical protein